MNLCVDVGNTLIKFGVFNNNELIDKFVIPSKENYSTEQYVGVFKEHYLGKIKNICYSSVATRVNMPLTKALKKAYGCNILIINKDIKSDLDFEIDDKDELGSDLLAALVSTKERHGYPAIIADLGTATKFLILDKEGKFISCFILPGMDSSVNSLFSNTSLLPEIKLVKPDKFFAKNTFEAINNGIVFSQATSLVGMAEKIEKELGYTCLKYITGGYSKLVIDEVKSTYTLDKELVLYGLNLLLEKNARKIYE